MGNKHFFFILFSPKTLKFDSTSSHGISIIISASIRHPLWYLPTMMSGFNEPACV